MGVALALMASVGGAAVGCGDPGEPAFSFYGERIEPVLQNNCSRQNTGCHVPQADGTSLGNLDMTSFDSLMRRDDVLAPYGPYSTGLLLLKGGEPVPVQVQTFDPAQPFISITTDIRHNAGTNVDLGSSGYSQIRQWVAAGHSRTGLPDDTLSDNSPGCRSGVGEARGFSADVAPADTTSYELFTNRVQPVLRNRCAGSTCHGSPIADLYLACGDDEEELRWNYFITRGFLASPVSTSPLLRRPLSTLRGGVFHEGGNVFASTDDQDYEVLRSWGEELIGRIPEVVGPPANLTEGERFFANRVQPTMVRKGCMFLNCHSPSMFHDLRLRGGSGGIFSPIATFRNYEMSREQLALDSPDPNQSRLIAKNLFAPEQTRGATGLFHRGGSLLEDFGASGDGEINFASPDDCDLVDADGGDLNEVPAYCIFTRWHEIEREEAVAAGEIFGDEEVVRGVVWVSRPTGVGDPRDFDTYRPGADLRRAAATYDAATGALTLDDDVSILAGCNLAVSTADIRGPAVSWDGRRVAFAARSAVDTPFRIFEMSEDGSSCAPVAGLASTSLSQDGILTHDIDPAYAPDGRLVFASSRGYLDAAIHGRAGPTRTPAEMQPNANLFIRDEDGSVRQLTYLLNQEIQPSFMTDGRVIFTAEKRARDFHQLAGRRLNLDGGDYHPLFAQRGSVGYGSATEIVELYNRNLALVAAPIDAADGAGTVVVVNRSIGPDQDDRDPNDRYYVASSRIPNPGAFGSGSGAYRSPAPLPDGRILVSCDRSATSLTAGGYDFDLCILDPSDGLVLNFAGIPDRADIEAVPIVSRAPRHVFESRIDEANGTTRVEEGATDAEVEFLDFPLLATLLFDNTREGRPIDPNVGGMDVYAERPPPAGATTFGDVAAQSDAFGQYYEQRELLGHVDLNPDGSARYRIVGGTPISLTVTDWDGEPLMHEAGGELTGLLDQREAMQFYPGERARQSFPRTLFNGMCGGCHGSISNRELDVAADVDVLTRASLVMSANQSPVDLR